MEGANLEVMARTGYGKIMSGWRIFAEGSTLESLKIGGYLQQLSRMRRSIPLDYIYYHFSIPFKTEETGLKGDFSGTGGKQTWSCLFRRWELKGSTVRTNG